jgi:hypothetical protein
MPCPTYGWEHPDRVKYPLGTGVAYYSAAYVSDLEARLEKASKVIEPFANDADNWRAIPDDERLVDFSDCGVGSSATVAHLRAARAWMEQNAPPVQP